MQAISSFELRRGLAGLALGAVLGAGCSLTGTDVTECDSNAECRSAFGVGFVCASDGLCDEAAPSPRCTQTFPEDLFENRSGSRGKIVVGNLMDRSVETHVARERSAQLAYTQVNGENGIDDREVAAVFCTIEENPELDDLTRVEAAVASAEFLTEIVGVPAIVGPAASGDTQEVFLDVAERGVLVISPSATSPALTALDPADVSDDSPGLLWRTAASDALQGAVIAADMRGPGEGRAVAVTSVAAIHEVGAYGDGLYEVFARAFVESGGTVEEIAYDGEGQLTDAIADGQASGADEVLFISSQAVDIIDFLDGAANLPGYDDKGIFLTDAAANPDVLANANPARLGQVRATRAAPLSEADDVVYASFIAAYTAEFDEDVRSFSFAANAYDAAWLVIYGVAWALFQEGGELTGATIARGLRRVSSGDAVDLRPSDWTSVRDAFREGASVDASGASGALDYDPATEETAADIQVWRIQDRAAVGIYKVSP